MGIKLKGIYLRSNVVNKKDLVVTNVSGDFFIFQE